MLPWYSRVHAEDMNATEHAWDDATCHHSLFEVEHRLQRGARGYEWFRTTARPIFNDDGSFKQWNGICVALDLRPRSPPVRTVAAAQLRAARAILRWSVFDLSRESSISPAAIRRLEEQEARSAGRGRPQEDQASA